MHAFSYSIKNIISFRGIVLPPPLPEDAKDQSGRSIPRFNFYPTTRISVLLPAAPFPSFLHPLSSRFTCFSSPWPISVALTTGASQPRSFPLLPLSRVLCHPRSLVLSLSLSSFFSPSVSLWLALAALVRPVHTRKGKFSLLEFSPLLAKLRWYYPTRKFRDIPWREIYRKINYATWNPLASDGRFAREPRREGESEAAGRRGTRARFESPILSRFYRFSYVSVVDRLSSRQRDKTLPRHESFFRGRRIDLLEK